MRGRQGPPFSLPSGALEIIHRLNQAGYEAYAVGGCVRDLMLGEEPKDWDITTSAAPEQVKSLFHRTVDTGIAHGTVTVMLGRDGYEVTTYRIDGKYEDGRHPTEVIFTPSLREDLRRRDFTINAMAYHPDLGLVDLFDGQKDLEEGVLRCVGDPMERFSEDALRMLRAVRFSGQLGFCIEEETMDAICALAPSIRKVSAERIREEWTKLLLSPYPQQMKAAQDSGLLAVLFPGWTQSEKEREDLAISLSFLRQGGVPFPEKYHDTLQQDTLSKSELFALAYSLQFWSSHQSVNVVKRLKFDNKTLSLTHFLERNGRTPLPDDLPGLREKLGSWGLTDCRCLLLFWECLLQPKPDKEEKLLALHQKRQQISRILSSGDCLTLGELAITGEDCIACGIPAGRDLGNYLSRALREVYQHPEYNNRETLLGLIASWREEQKTREE